MWHLGKSERSAELCAAAGVTPADLYLRHMARVVSHVRRRAPRLRVLLWHDMIERVDLDRVPPELAAAAEPVVWRLDSKVTG